MLSSYSVSVSDGGENCKFMLISNKWQLSQIRYHCYPFYLKVFDKVARVDVNLGGGEDKNIHICIKEKISFYFDV